jgi:hypothetical protein
MDDLTLCKKIAEIEGLPLCDEWDCCDNGVLTGTGKGDLEHYNPLTKWSLLGPLMLKYEIEISYDNGFAVIHRKNVKAWGVTAIKSDKAGIPRAILECIVEANRWK